MIFWPQFYISKIGPVCWDSAILRTATVLVYQPSNFMNRSAWVFTQSFCNAWSISIDSLLAGLQMQAILAGHDKRKITGGKHVRSSKLSCHIDFLSLAESGSKLEKMLPKG